MCEANKGGHCIHAGLFFNWIGVYFGPPAAEGAHDPTVDKWIGE